jgi:hypothetical protein
MPVTIGLVAAGIQGLGGIYQAATSGRGDAENQLNAFAKQSPLAKESKSLNDYYQEALNRYQENPYQSQAYQVGAMNAQRATAQGIGALQDRRSAIGGVGRLAAGQQNAMQNLGAQVEAQRNARFGQLGQATQAKTAQDKYLFDVNQMTPYNRQLQLKQMASQAANERYNAGLQMVGGALGNAAQIGAMSAYGKAIKPPVTPPVSSQSTFNSWMENPSLKPTINPSFIPKTQALTPRSPYISGATAYFPNAY